MKKITWVVLWVFLYSIFWVNAWPQQLPNLSAHDPADLPPDSSVAQNIPKISVSPASLNFGTLSSGSSSEKAVTIRNNGKADVVISSITLSGNNAADFNQTNRCGTLPSTLPGGSSCIVAVMFSPASGGKKSGLLSVASNDPKKPLVNVKLSGNAKAPACAYSLTSTSQQCDASGGTWSVDVKAPGGCSWTATTKTSWITITSGGSGSGNGSVGYTVAANTTSSQRTGTMSIAKQTFTVTQAGAPACTYSISPTSQSFGPSGGTGSVTVTSPSGCNWTAVSNASWITISSGSSGSGNGSVGYTVLVNSTTSERTKTMTVAGQTFTVTQSPCLPPGTPSGPSPSNDTTGVSTSPTLSWAATSNTDSYDVYLGTSSHPPYAGDTTSTSYRASELTSDTDYFWKVVAKNNCGNSTFGPVWSFTTGSAPIYTLSEYQEALIEDYGNPDYLTIVFNSDPERREETWFYTEHQKMYLFWDGKIVDEKDITVDPAAALSPPYIDPSVFTKDTKLPDLGELLGNYTAVDQSSLSDVIGDVNFKTYYFSDQGLFVTFLDESLAAIQTIDIPETSGELFTAESLAGKELTAGIGTREVSASGKTSPNAMLNLAILTALVYAVAGVHVGDDPAMQTFHSEGCSYIGMDPNTEKGKNCLSLLRQALRNAAAVLQSSNEGLRSIGQQTETLDNAGTCTYSISPTSTPFNPGGGGGSFEVTTQAGCTFTSVSNVFWITVSQAASSAKRNVQPLLSYVYTVQYTVAPNTSGADRTGTITTAGQTVTVTQSPCTYSVSPTSESFDPGGGTGSIEVTTPIGCTFTVVSNVAWITVSQGGGSAGMNVQPLLSYVYTVRYTVAPNTSGADRTGTLTVAGQAVTVTQSSCTYSVSPTSESFDPGGGTGSIEVTTQMGCTFSAASNVSWITVSSASSSAKMKVQPLLSVVSTVSYTVAANTSGSDRTGTITVAGQTVTVTQSPCTYSISPASQSFDAGGGTGSFEVTMKMGCTFTAVSNASWITVSSASSSAKMKVQPLLSVVSTVSYTVAANTSGSDRTGTITVAGQTFTVSQSGPPPCTSYTSSDSACQQDVPWNGIVGLGTITTTYTGVPAGCVGSITIPQPTTRCCDGFNPC